MVQRKANHPQKNKRKNSIVTLGETKTFIDSNGLSRSKDDSLSYLNKGVPLIRKSTKTKPLLLVPKRVLKTKTKQKRRWSDEPLHTDKPEREHSGFAAYIQALPSYELLSDAEEKKLVKVAQSKSIKSNKAIEILILSNMRLVISMAKKYTKYGCPMEDLVSEGSIGLGVAIEKYKAHKGARLSTYAVWWIKQYLRKATNDSARTIKIPIYQQKTLRAINATINKLKETTGLDPSDDEIAGELGLSTKHVQTLRHATVPLVSLQNPVGNQENSRTYEEILCDESGSTESPLEKLSKKTAAEGLLTLIQKRLSKKEQDVIVLRFGLDGKSMENRTLEEVGNILKLTRERIRQIQESALKKLKRSLEAEAANKPTLMTVLQSNLT
jgi:RNA polymerase primary sigma factor